MERYRSTTEERYKIEILILNFQKLFFSIIFTDDNIEGVENPTMEY